MHALIFLSLAAVLYAAVHAGRYTHAVWLAVLGYAGLVVTPFAAVAAEAAGVVPLSPDWLPVILGAGALLLKTVMSLLDKVGALDKLPPYLKPFVTAAFAAVIALLEHLATGGDLPRAALVALAAFGGNELLHHTVKGVRRARASR